MSKYSILNSEEKLKEKCYLGASLIAMLNYFVMPTSCINTAAEVTKLCTCSSQGKTYIFYDFLLAQFYR
jgi:hypothetical protein